MSLLCGNVRYFFLYYREKPERNPREIPPKNTKVCTVAQSQKFGPRGGQSSQLVEPKSQPLRLPATRAPHVARKMWGGGGFIRELLKSASRRRKRCALKVLAGGKKTSLSALVAPDSTYCSGLKQGSLWPSLPEKCHESSRLPPLAIKPNLIKNQFILKIYFHPDKPTI